MDNPLISVIIPSYNRAHTIERAINSILKQTYKKIEIIVVDDASTDNTSQVIEDLQCNKIQCVKLKKNRGVSNARNVGIKKSNGTYIAFLDSDDEWIPEKLEKQLHIINNSKFKDLVVVTCGYKKVFENKNIIKIPKYKGRVLKKFVLGEMNDFQPQCWLIKSNILKGNSIYFDIHMHSAEDWDFMVQLLKVGELDYTPEILAIIYQTGTDHLWSREKHYTANLLQINKYENDEKFDDEMKSSLHLVTAIISLSLRKYDNAKDQIFRSIKKDFNKNTLVWSIIALLISMKLHKNKAFNHMVTFLRKRNNSLKGPIS